MLSERELYYNTHYKKETGIRIATTLGSFFLVVFLILLYKSKCKKETPSPTPAETSFLHLNQIHPKGPPTPHRINHQEYPHYPALLLTSAPESPEEAGRKLIDIHVILPTPTISPSSSTQFDQQRKPFCPSLSETFKYVDDTSSENIPGLESRSGSLCSGSDSVFASPPAPDQITLLTPTMRRVSTGSGYSGLSSELVQVQVHRGSFCSSMSGESVSGYVEGRRRSSSTQTTVSDLQACLGVAGSPNLLLPPLASLAPREGKRMRRGGQLDQQDGDQEEDL